MFEWYVDAQAGRECRSVLQCVAVCCSVLQCINGMVVHTQGAGVDLCCKVLQCVAVCCSVLQCVAVCKWNGGA